MRRKIAACFAACSLVAQGALIFAQGVGASAASAQRQGKTAYSLSFDAKNYTAQTATVEGKTVAYRAFENIVYVRNPVDTKYQCLNFYVPEAYYSGASIGGYTSATVPIFFPNTVGGYMPGEPDKPGEGREGRTERDARSLVERLRRGLPRGARTNHAGLKRGLYRQGSGMHRGPEGRGALPALQRRSDARRRGENRLQRHERGRCAIRLARRHRRQRRLRALFEGPGRGRSARRCLRFFLLLPHHEPGPRRHGLRVALQWSRRLQEDRARRDDRLPPREKGSVREPDRGADPSLERARGPVPRVRERPRPQDDRRQRPDDESRWQRPHSRTM